jgi:hypothetical protein
MRAFTALMRVNLVENCPLRHGRVADTRARSVLSHERSDYIIPTCSGHKSARSVLEVE